MIVDPILQYSLKRGPLNEGSFYTVHSSVDAAASQGAPQTYWDRNVWCSYNRRYLISRLK